MKRGLRPVAVGAAVLVALVALATAAVVYLNLRGESSIDETAAAGPPNPAQIERGRYLALLGNCAGCHTRAGGAPYAGGRALPTPFGTVYAGNLTPDVATGIGSWTAAQFWRALHHGRSSDGRLLNPVFPYLSYTHVTRADADALHAFLRSLAPVSQANRPHALRFPYGTQPALAVWRALYFRAADPAADAARDVDRTAQWRRGAYLARGLGHCIECHSPRNALGAISGATELAGGAIPAQGWYAPSLTAADEAGVADWRSDRIVELLKSGRSNEATALGPMAEVVYGSTQHWTDADLQAVADFLQQLPPAAPRRRPRVDRPDSAAMALGARLYERHCVACHGSAGEGVANVYPPLAGNRAVTMAVTTNLGRVVRGGGFAPATAGNPRPYGMPPFGHLLDDAEIAAVLTYIRQAWGNSAPPVTALQLLQQARDEN